MKVHSIIISGQNTYDVWGLVPTSRPVINPPSPKITCFDLPGTHGQLDLTEVLLGETPMGPSEGSWEFWLKPGKKWVNVYSSLMKSIHGVEHTVVLEDDPARTYKGRLTINTWRSEPENSIIVIDYILTEETEG